MLRKILTFSIISGVLIFVISLYLPSFTQMRQLKEKNIQLAKEIEQVKLQNLELEKQALLLRTDTKYLEKVLREDLGMVKPGEVLYKVVQREQREVNS